MTKNALTDILNNAQAKLNPIYLVRYKPRDEWVAGSVSVTVDMVFDHSTDRWVDVSLPDYVAGFEWYERRVSPHDRKMSEHLRDGFEIRRAAAMVATRSRRGMGNTVYVHGTLPEETAELLPDMWVIENQSFVPEGAALVMFEGSPMDVGFIYDPARGILPNVDDRDYGRLVKLTER